MEWASQKDALEDAEKGPDGEQISQCFLHNQDWVASVSATIALVQSFSSVFILSTMLPGNLTFIKLKSIYFENIWKCVFESFLIHVKLVWWQK